MSVRSYQDLEVWKTAMELASGIYQISAQLPDTERFGLRTQLQRAAVSVPSNIAEGHARCSTREFLKFISIAHGSLAELETQLQLLPRLGLLAVEHIEEALHQADRVGRMLRRLSQALNDRMNPESRVRAYDTSLDLEFTAVIPELSETPSPESR